MKCRPKVEIGIYLLNSNCDKILLGKNKFESFWRLINGKLSFGETFEDCAYKSLYEQVNIKGGKERLSCICTLNVLDKTTKFHCLEIDYFIQITESEEVELNNLRSIYKEWKLFSFGDILASKEIFCGILVFLKKYNVTGFNQIKSLVSN